MPNVSKSRFRQYAADVDTAYTRYQIDPTKEPELWEALTRMSTNLAESFFRGPNEDASQEGLAQLVKALKRGRYIPRSDARFSTWVKKVLRRAYIGYARKEAVIHRAQCPLEELPPETFNKLSAKDPYETQQLIENALGKLSSKTQKVVRMHLAGETFKSIGEKLSMKGKTAQWHWQTAIKKLRT